MSIKPILKSLTAVLGVAVAGAALASGGGTAPRTWNEGGGEQDAALSLTADRERGIAVYEVCSACHLLEGWGLTDGTFPQLAGQHRKVLIKQLADIRAQNRDNPTMYPFALDDQILAASGYHEGEIEPAQLVADVTDYISKLPMNPENGQGQWNNLFPEFAQGKKLYEDNCVKCHAENGEGSNDKFYPKIQGQHYAYMMRQFEWIRDGKRRNANPEMVEQIKNFTDKDMAMVINYVSRIPVPKDKVAPSKDWQNPDYD